MGYFFHFCTYCISNTVFLSPVSLSLYKDSPVEVRLLYDHIVYDWC